MTLLWPGFLLFILGMLALDLGVFHRKDRTISVRDALVWTGVWVGLAMLLNLGIYWKLGSGPALAFLTGYLIEKALSVDNLFVFLVIFTHFRVPERFQHKILFWGILSALALRAVFIFAGVALVERFHASLYIMGVFLIYTAVKMLFSQQGPEPEIGHNPVVTWLRRRVPLANHFGEGSFFVREKGRRTATMMFLVLVMVELTDIVFAVDSIPAILAITTDPFIVFSSNVMAIMGLRSLYFALAGMMRAFHYLHYGLAAILAFVGAKMLLVDVVELPEVASLAVVGGCLALSMLASWLWPQPDQELSSSQA